MHNRFNLIKKVSQFTEAKFAWHRRILKYFIEIYPTPHFIPLLSNYNKLTFWYKFSSGWDDRPDRVSRRARSGLRADGDPGHQEGPQVSIQGEKGE